MCKEYGTFAKHLISLLMYNLCNWFCESFSIQGFHLSQCYFAKNCKSQILTNSNMSQLVLGWGACSSYYITDFKQKVFAKMHNETSETWWTAFWALGLFKELEESQKKLFIYFFQTKHYKIFLFQMALCYRVAAGSGHLKLRLPQGARL